MPGLNRLYKAEKIIGKMEDKSEVTIENVAQTDKKYKL